LAELPIVEASVKQIDPNPYQTRREFDEEGLQELATSIRVHGFYGHLVARQVDDRYQLAYGERRLRAAQRAGLTQLPLAVRDLTDGQMMDLALIPPTCRSPAGLLTTPGISTLSRSTIPSTARASRGLYEQGGEALTRGLALFDLEWDNIQAGQAWAAAHAEGDETAARLCITYPDAGAYGLNLRQHPREWIHWLERAVVAARRLEDRPAEGVFI
jgi:hypothetical protein